MIFMKNHKTFTFDFMEINYTKLECDRIEEWKQLGHASIVFEVSQLHEGVCHHPHMKLPVGVVTYYANVTITNKYSGNVQVIELPSRFALGTFREINESDDLYGTTLPQLATKIMQELRAQAVVTYYANAVDDCSGVDIGLIKREMLRLIADVVLNPHPDVHS